MGILRKSNIVWDEETIQNKLSRNFMSESNIKFCAENLYIYGWESDLWIMTKSDVVYEFEIKISKADYKNDFKKKTKKHTILESVGDDTKFKPTYFYYAVPEGLIDIKDVPDYAGLIYMTEHFPYYEVIKQPLKLTNKKYSVDELNLLEKFYYNYRDWRLKTRAERKRNEELNNLIDSYQGKPEGEKKPYTKLLEETKANKIVAENEGHRADRYFKLYNEEKEYNRNLDKMINKLLQLLDENNIKYDYVKMFKDIYEGDE